MVAQQDRVTQRAGNARIRVALPAADALFWGSPSRVKTFDELSNLSEGRFHGFSKRYVSLEASGVAYSENDVQVRIRNRSSGRTCCDSSCREIVSILAVAEGVASARTFTWVVPHNGWLGASINTRKRHAVA